LPEGRGMGSSIRILVMFFVLIFTFESNFSYSAKRRRNPRPPRSDSSDPIMQQTGRRAAKAERLKICSFNVFWVGYMKNRHDEALGNILKKHECDIVVVQELCAPPDHPELREFPDGTPIKPSDSATRFFAAMEDAGYDDFVISEEDSGPTRNHTNTSQSEWYVTFYKSSKVRVASDLPQGFLVEDSSELTAHEVFPRVPYAVAFRSVNGNADFVLISVHLTPKKARHAERKKELELIGVWIRDQHWANPERDYIILGDMNIESQKELKSATPQGYVSLNTNASHNTNTNVNSKKPYDHVMVVSDPEINSEIKIKRNFKVIDLIKETKSIWAEQAPFPGKPYSHREFASAYSDHNPVTFYLDISGDDDD